MINDNFEKKLISMTSIIIGNYTVDKITYSLNASGFFYTEQTPTEPEKKGPQWVRIDKYWLITNRHVVLPKKEINGQLEEILLDNMVFGFRKNSSEHGIEWHSISLTKDELQKNLKFHSDNTVDVVAIDISHKIQEIISSIRENKLENNIGIPTMISNRDLPGEKPIPIEVTSDIIVASYPKGFYDTTNKFPIVKSGIIASAGGSTLTGNQCSKSMHNFSLVLLADL